MDKSIHGEQDLILRGILRQLREDSGLRQVDLARRLGEPQSFVSKYESGERRLDLMELRRICAALDTTLLTIVEQFEGGIRGTK